MLAARKKKRRIRILCGIAAMAVFMIADWLIGAVGIQGGVNEPAAKSAWLGMAGWRFTAAAMLAGAAMPPAYLAAMELSGISREVEMAGNSIDRLLGIGYRTGILCFLTARLALYSVRSILPAAARKAYELMQDPESALAVSRAAGRGVLLLPALFGVLAGLGVSAAWIYMVIKKRLSVPFWAAFFCPLFTWAAGWLLRRTGIQFFEDLTAAFGSLGWMLMFCGAYLHEYKRTGYMPA